MGIIVRFDVPDESPRNVIDILVDIGYDEYRYSDIRWIVRFKPEVRDIENKLKRYSCFQNILVL